MYIYIFKATNSDHYDFAFKWFVLKYHALYLGASWIMESFLETPRANSQLCDWHFTKAYKCCKASLFFMDTTYHEVRS